MQPHDAIADLEAGIFDCAGQAMEGSRASEREHILTGLQDVECRNPIGDTGYATIPVFPQEFQAVRWICDNAIDLRLGQRLHYLDRIAAS